MAGTERLICGSASLEEGGAGVRFEVQRHGEPASAFAVRYDGTVHGYLNRCAHVPIELDWQEGAFFDITGLYLICATHGATYLPDTGRCVRGPCKGAALVKLPILERDGAIYLLEDEFDHGRQ